MTRSKKRKPEPYATDFAERIAAAESVFRFQELNELLGKPVALAEVWEAAAELTAAHRDALSCLEAESQAMADDLEIAEGERREEEERADNAEDEAADLECKVADLEMKVDDLTAELEDARRELRELRGQPRK